MNKPHPELFLVTGLAILRHDYDHRTKSYHPVKVQEQRLIPERTLRTHLEYPQACGFEVQTSQPLGILWPEGVEVEELTNNSDNRRCLSTATYRVTSPRELTDGDWRVLRASDAFMNGQECGIVTKSEQTADGWVYHCRSLCDSSD
jgi:hypothetical protein